MSLIFYVASGLPRGSWVEFGTQPHSTARGASIVRGKLQDIRPSKAIHGRMRRITDAVRGLRTGTTGSGPR